MNENNLNEIKSLLEEVKSLLLASQRDFPKYVNSVDKDANSIKNSADYLKNSMNTFNNHMENRSIDKEELINICISVLNNTCNDNYYSDITVPDYLIENLRNRGLSENILSSFKKENNEKDNNKTLLYRFTRNNNKKIRE